MLKNNMEAQKSYDLTYLYEISGGEQGFVVEMISDFIINAPDVLAKAKELCAISDWSGLYALMHRFAPAYDFVAATPVIALVKSIEDAAKNITSLENLPLLISNLEQKSLQIIVDLKVDFKIA